MEESEAARVYHMVPYKWQEKVQAEEQKRARWRTVVKVPLPQQQHQGLLQWINSWATAHYGFNTMQIAPMLTTDDGRKGDSLKAMDRFKWTTGMLKVHAIDPPMTADETIDFISKMMTLQHRKEAQHQDRGGQRNWQPRDVRQTDAGAANHATPAKQDRLQGSGSAFDASRGKPQSQYPEVGVQAVDAILAEVYRVQSTCQANAARKRNELRRWGTPPLSFREYREKHGRPDGKGGCYVCQGGNRDHRHDHTCCKVNKKEKAQYFQRHPDKVPQRDQRGSRDPPQDHQIDANKERYAQLMVENQELRNQLATNQPQVPSGAKA